ncbi:sarcosine oxidase subunit gamma [Thalassococcus sp. BH17M4-6]|uniref:sarcosine oxidase subunit gamma n=1 Tax=Thalassococcus sp. BH17M4-6 TaxID=3413148 RepID=UPI003BC49497
MTKMTQPFVAGPLASSDAVTLELMQPVARFSLRARGGAVAALGTALDLTLPEKIGTRANKGKTEVLCLGPDEWHVLAAESDAAGIVKACADVYADAPHSLTEVSDREVTVRITGPKAAEVLTLGCPRDIDGISVGSGRRTIFDGATVLLWRDGDTEFRMDIWRSFVPHVVSLLETGTVELAGE